MLAILAVGGFEAPNVLCHAESALDGVEAEEIVTVERRCHTARRKVSPHRAIDPSNPVCVAPAQVDIASAAHAAAPLERDSGRDLRYRHESLLI